MYTPMNKDSVGLELVLGPIVLLYTLVSEERREEHRNYTGEKVFYRVNFLTFVWGYKILGWH